jgi:GT2 family glycosyltransferase
MIAYCIPTYNSFDRCVEAIHAVMRGTVIPDKLIIADDSGTGAALEVLVPVLKEYHEQGRIVSLLVHERRCGVAASWNQLMQTTDCEYTIIANDDAIVHVHTIEAFITAAREQPDQVFFAGDGYSGNTFSLFLLTRTGYDKIGVFDETFFPAYFEDNDYSRRITLAGYKHVIVDKATYGHVGSSTLHRYSDAEREKHHQQFRANRDYYLYKWGGEPGKEIYHTPFGK